MSGYEQILETVKTVEGAGFSPLGDVPAGALPAPPRSHGVAEECPCRRRLKGLLLESVQVLEESRKAFKSKNLETLRKKMIRVLAEEA